MILYDATNGYSLPLKAGATASYPETPTAKRNCTKVTFRHKSFGVVLEVITGVVRLNGLPVREKALMSPGDELVIDGNTLFFVCDESVPPQCKMASVSVPAKLPEETIKEVGPGSDETNGIRWLGGVLDGHFQAISRQTAIDCGNAIVLGQNNKLVLRPHPVANEDTLVRVNGHAVFKTNTSPVALRHGDVVQSGQWRFRVEMPGDTGESAFSPSHPHNIQLSEEYHSVAEQECRAFRRPNRFLWAVIGGLAFLLVFILWLALRM